MKNFFVRIASLGMTLALALTAAGCGEGKKDDKDSSKVGSKSNTDTSFFDNIPSELEGTTVKYATWIDHTANESAQVLKDFTDLTGIKVQIVNIPQTGYVTQVAALIASGESPDVVVNNSEFPAVLQLMQPLNGIIDTTDTFWNPEITKLGTIGGKSYLVNVAGGAWDTGSSLVYYNSRIFEENGITTPELYKHEGRWTLDNFFKCAKELSKVCKSTGACVAFSTYMNTYASGMVSYDYENQQFKSNINSPDFVTTLQKLIEAKEAGYIACDDGGLRNYFIDEEAGMCMIGSYGLRKTGWFKNMDSDDLAFIEMPRADAGSSAAKVGASLRSYGIAKGSKNAQGAAYFLRYFLDRNNYDDDEIFLNEDAANMYEELIKSADIAKSSFDHGVMNILATTASPIYEFFPELFRTSAAQIPVILNKSANQLESCILRANVILSKVKSENQ